jgi:hypothetical protein
MSSVEKSVALRIAPPCAGRAEAMSVSKALYHCRTDAGERLGLRGRMKEEP